MNVSSSTCVLQAVGPSTAPALFLFCQFHPLPAINFATLACVATLQESSDEEKDERHPQLHGHKQPDPHNQQGSNGGTSFKTSQSGSNGEAPCNKRSCYATA